jgi:hypothetical protein
MAILAGGLAGGGAACRYEIDAVRAGMRDVIGCEHLRYSPGPADWPLVACRAAKAWPLRNTRCGTLRGLAGC